MVISVVIYLFQGHFTQLVWKTSKKLGIGQAKGASGNVYVVANYYPPGNIIGEFGSNVFVNSDKD
jgi:ves G 5 allergen, putative